MDFSGPSKSELAYRFLLQQLVEAKIPPDTPLRLPALDKESGLGTTPLREALRRLESERFVVMENNRGFRAAPLTHAELADLEATRLVVESALMKEAIRHGDDAWEAEILSAHHLLMKAPEPAETRDFEELKCWSDRHRRFHRALVAAARSGWLNLFYDQISNHLDRHFYAMFTGTSRARYLAGTDLVEQSRAVLGMDHHTALMQAVMARDEATSMRLLHEHVGFTRRFFSQVEAPSAP